MCDAEIGEAGVVAEPTVPAPLIVGAVGLRVAGCVALGDCRDEPDVSGIT